MHFARSDLIRIVRDGWVGLGWVELVLVPAVLADIWLCCVASLMRKTCVRRPVNAVHFWAPTFKWGISIANIADFSKPPEKLSYPQQIGKSLKFFDMYAIAERLSNCWYHYDARR